MVVLESLVYLGWWPRFLSGMVVLDCLVCLGQKGGSEGQWSVILKSALVGSTKDTEPVGLKTRQQALDLCVPPSPKQACCTCVRARIDAKADVEAGAHGSSLSC